MQIKASVKRFFVHCIYAFVFVCMLVSPVFHNSMCHLISKVQANQAKTKQRKQNNLLGKVHVKDIVMKFNYQKTQTNPHPRISQTNKENKGSLIDKSSGDAGELD